MATVENQQSEQSEHAVTALVASRAPVQLTPRHPALSEEQKGDHKRQIALLSREVNEIGWGNQGDLIGMRERVELRKLWVDTLQAIDYADEEIVAMMESLRSEGQKDDLVVAYAQLEHHPDDYYDDPPCLLVVKGRKRWLAMQRLGWEFVHVRAEAYTSMWQVKLDQAARALSAHVLTGMEIGRLILNTRLAYDYELRRGANPNLGKYPTQAQLAAQLGRSQASISQWLTIAEQPPAIIEMVYAGTLAPMLALTLARTIPNERDRIRQAEKMAREGVSVRGANARLRLTAPGVPLSLPGDRPIPYESLWTPRLDPAASFAQAAAYAAHDLYALCVAQEERVRADGGKEPRALTKVRLALSDPDIQVFMQQFAPDEGAGSDDGGDSDPGA